MKERPILFQGAMVRALLAGTKTQTRRAVKPQPERTSDGVLMWASSVKGMRFGVNDLDIPPGALARCPYGQPGDRLWVREAWTTHKFMDAIPPRDLQTTSIAYVADGKIETGKYRQAFHMPRRYSRITLEVTGVRVERLQDISEADALAEGVSEWARGAMSPHDGQTWPAALQFEYLWNSINGPGSWEANPFVWVVTFKRITP